MNCCHILNQWSPLIVLFAAFATAVAAYAAWRSSNAAKKGIQAQILMNAFSEYASPEMDACIDHLYDYKESVPNNFVLSYYEKKNSPKIVYSEVESARRIVSHYFQKISALQKAGIIKKDFVKLLISGEQAEILFELIEPLDEANNPNYDLGCYNLFRELNPDESKKWRRHYITKDS